MFKPSDTRMAPIVDLSGTIVKDNNSIELVCASNEISYRDSATFLVNGNIHDYIKLVGDVCTDIRGNICETQCRCMEKSKTLYLDLTDYKVGDNEFSCMMRFEGVGYEYPIEAQSTTSFNGTDFQQLSNVIIQKDTKTRIPDTESLPFIASAIAISIFLIALIFVIVYIYRRTKKTANKYQVNKRQINNKTDTNTKNSGEENQPVTGNKFTGICSTCTKDTARLYCAKCKMFLCKNCVDKHSQNCKQRIHEIYEEYIKLQQIPEKCHTCMKKKAILICADCKEMYCQKCKCNHEDYESKVYFRIYIFGDNRHIL